MKLWEDPLKTLIVEDNLQDRRLLRYYLERNGCEVVEATDGEVGFQLAEKCRPALIISDALMPRVDGFQFLRKIRRHDKLFNTPFVFYSAVYTGTDDQRLALSLGADAFIVKPKEADEFWQELKEVLEDCRLKAPRTPATTVEGDKEFLEQYSQLVASKLGEKAHQLQQSEERYRSLVEMSPDWIWEFDENHIFTYVSPKVRDLLGFEPEELLGKNAFDPMRTYEADRVDNEFFPITEKQKPFHGLININRHKDGHPVIIESSGVPLFDEDGVFRGYRGVDRDVTDRVEAEKKNKKLEARFQTTFAQMAVGMVQIAPDGHFLQTNQKMCELLGYSEDELLQKTFLDITHPNDIDQDKQLAQSLLDGTNESVTLEKRYIHKTGHPVWVKITGSLVRTTEGEPDYFIAIIEDIAQQKEAEENLKESETRFRGVFQQMAVGTLLADPQERFLVVNDKMCEIVGYTQDELLDKTFLDITHPDDLPKNKDIVARLLDRTLKSISFEKRYMRKDGSFVWVNITSSVVFSDNGEPEYFVAVVEDIQQRQELKQTLELTQHCVDQTLDAVFWVREDGKFIYANEAACNSLGYSRDELLELHVPEVDSSLTKESWSGFWEKALQETHLRFEAVHRRKDGLTFPVDIQVSHLHFGDSNLLHAHVRNITDSKKQQNKLESAIRVANRVRNELNAVLESITDAVIVTDTRGHIVMANDRAERIFGKTSIKIQGKSLAEITDCPELATHVFGAEHDQFDYMSSFLEMTDQERNERRAYEARTGHVHHEGDSHRNHVTIIRDITRERESDRLKSEFIATAAHELRTPLTAILGFSELLYEDRDKLPEHDREYLEDIIERSEVLEKLIDQLLNLSRIETGRPLMIETRLTDLIPLIDNTLSQYHQENADGRFRVDVQAESLLMMIDGPKIGQVLENLTTNAIKYSPEDSLIDIRITATADEVQISIQDQGKGMTPEQLQHVFEKFYRADSSDTAVRGLGLGMSIAKMIIEEHGGSIWVESEHGKGTRACFSLPRSLDQQQPADVMSQSKPSPLIQ